MRTAAFSIISPNYRHFARVLMGSVRQQHPEWDRFILLVGESGSGVPEEPSFATIRLESLPLPHFRQFVFRYTILELNTAVKPWMFEHLFAQGYDRVVYLDPDIFVYSPLAELGFEALLTLTPHLTNFNEGRPAPSEPTILLAGAYNLGFLSVNRTPSLPRFLAWWQEKLERQCVVDPAHGFFVDQKWMDLAPGLFPGVSILRHEGYNTAYWNLEHRQVRVEGEAPSVNGQPLRFFHFSGFDPAFPGFVSRHHQGLRTSEADEVSRLFARYAEALYAAGYASFKDARYGYGTFHDGSRVPNTVRWAYRHSPFLQSACGEDPFAHPELFRHIDEGRPAPLAASMRAKSYSLLSRARPIVALIPRRVRTAMRDFLLLSRHSPVPRTRSRASALPPGLNVVGYATRDTGAGQSARLCAQSCRAAGLPNHLLDIDGTDAFARQPVHRASVYHVDADRMQTVHDEVPYLFSASAYNIGCWHRELPELSDTWLRAAGPLDEIWAPSTFIQSVVSRSVSIPVVHMPHGIALTEIEACSPEELGVPHGSLTFLCRFDLDGAMARKNPYGAVEAFRRAFPNGGNAALLVRAGHAEAHPQEYAELEERLRGIPNVYLTGRMLTRARLNGLLAACDGVISLHRSEGFGLFLAEAMALGKPVVATNWSGNTDFMNGSNSCPVDYELVPLETHHHDQTGQSWAEPDLEHAASLLRKLANDDTYRSRLGARAEETIRTRFSPEAAGRRYRERLSFLGLLNPLR